MFVGSEQVSSRTLNGPLWTGPLHSTDDVKNMTEMAKSWGWIEGDLEPAYERRRSPPVSTKDRNLKKLLSIMLEESNPDLQVGYIELDQVLYFFDCYAHYNYKLQNSSYDHLSHAGFTLIDSFCMLFVRFR